MLSHKICCVFNYQFHMADKHRPHNACLSSHWHFQLGVCYALAGREFVPKCLCTGARREPEERRCWREDWCLRSLSATRSRVFIIFKFPNMEAAKQPLVSCLHKDLPTRKKKKIKIMGKSCTIWARFSSPFGWRTFYILGPHEASTFRAYSLDCTCT